MPKSRLVVYEEVVAFPLWATILLLALVLGVTVPLVLELQNRLANGSGGLLTIVPLGGSAAASVVIPAVIYLLFGRLLIQVTRTSLYLQFGFLPFISKVVPFSDIDDMEVVRYRPLMEFGGWGIRGSWKGDKSAWTLKGDQALVLHLSTGKRFYVGSETPERLKSRIDMARAGSVDADRN